MNTQIKQYEIEKIIPKSHFNSAQIELAKNHTEWCLTKYLINNKKYITIQIKHPDEEAPIFIDAKGDTVLFQLDNTYDKYVKERIYWYCSQL